MARRMKQEGSVYRRASDGRWIGAVTLGYNAAGRQVRKTVSATTADEARKKLDAVRRKIEGKRAFARRDAHGEVAHGAVATSNGAKGEATGICQLLLHREAPHRARSRAQAGRQAFAPRRGSTIRLKMESGLSSSTVKRIRGVLSMAIDHAMKWGVVNRNVVTLSDQSEAHVQGRQVAHAGTGKSPVEGAKRQSVRDCVPHNLALGLRRGELLGLRWEDIDFERRTLTVNQTIQRVQGELTAGPAKTVKSRRTLNLPPQLAKPPERAQDRWSTPGPAEGRRNMA